MTAHDEAAIATASCCPDRASQVACRSLQHDTRVSARRSRRAAGDECSHRRAPGDARSDPPSSGGTEDALGPRRLDAHVPRFEQGQISPLEFIEALLAEERGLRESRRVKMSLLPSAVRNPG